MAANPAPADLAIIGTDAEGVQLLQVSSGLPVAVSPEAHAGPVLLLVAKPAEVALAERLDKDGRLWGVVAWRLAEAVVLRLLDLPNAPRVAVGVPDDVLVRLSSFGASERSAERASTAALVQLELASR